MLNIFKNKKEIFSIKRSENTCRFYIENNGKKYKLFSYFIQKDSSIGFHNYFKGTHSANSKMPPETVTKSGNTEIYQIPWKKLMANASDFKQHKTSLHKSGTIVTKNNAGLRISNERDSFSIPFEKIQEPKQVLHLVFSFFKDYEIGDNKISNIINISNVDIIPLVAKVFISPSSYNFIKSDLRSVVENTSIIFEDTQSLKKYNLYLYVVFLKSIDNFIPKAHAEAWSLW